MNSDSEREALELFDSAKPKAKSAKAAQPTDIKESNIRSILRQKIDREDDQGMEESSE